ncbi:MAG TPA: 6,7-dimethyl-8-ribityllumazine synthase [Dehalococcoidia bacterium]|nr:6,7-dimethyl-8-ribityllumazine synthase [Dehalococcoidia bacterium]
MKTYEGSFLGQGLRFALIVSRFNHFLTHRLLEGAQDCLLRHGVAEENIDIIWTPGTFEEPLVAKRLAQGGKYNAIICLGAIIRGDTPHFDYIAGEVTKGIAHVGMATGVPVLHGVITADNLEQAIARAGTKEGNKGFSAAQAALEMANLLKGLGAKGRATP